MTKIEEVAEAVEAIFYEYADADSHMGTDMAKRVARAAISALRKPSEAMWEAGHAALEVHGDSARASCWAWQAMIDCILKEQP